ncbi:MAG TPA: P-loop NTPase fold protein, partial [Candidatus Acidoferrum sp.]|nr:P-loop NTPase fold protein [Candidatus Acidoferrum sp.]
MTGDHPVASRSEDRLGRAHYADEIASAIRGMNAARGLVVGLTAPWGYGKTSVLNMVAEQLAVEPNLTVLPFNPWMFSGSDQLVHLFFEQIAAELRLRGGKANSKLADMLIAYGQAVGPLQFVPVAGVWISRAGALAAGAGKLMKGRKRPSTSATKQKEEIERALSDLARPLVVVLDDIDRLTRPEIRDIFRLVRLTAHFPNIIYMLAFDRGQVERALDDNAETGRAYLEKIIEVEFALPEIPEDAIVQILLSELTTAIGDQETGPFDDTRWPDVVFNIIRP